MFRRKASLGELIRRERKSRGLTQEGAAQKLGVTATTVFHWEKGIYSPSKDNLVAVSKFLHVDVAELL